MTFRNYCKMRLKKQIYTILYLIYTRSWKYFRSQLLFWKRIDSTREGDRTRKQKHIAALTNDEWPMNDTPLWKQSV